MSTQHTPGQWIAIYSTMHERTVIVTWNEKANFPKAVIAIMNTATHELDDQVSDEDKANARLVAAAPELLAALQSIDSNAAESVEWIRRVARTAIAKATTP